MELGRPVKIAPVSGNLLVEIALAGVVVLVLVKLAQSAADAASDALARAGNAAGDAAQTVAHAPSNAANYVASTFTGRDETLGGWIYDLTHPAPFDPGIAPAADNSIGGMKPDASGSWD